MKPDAMRAFREEVASKVEKNQAKIITWDDVKHDPPKELKLSPMAQIPHKSRAYRTLLDLSHEVMKEGQVIAPSVNSTTVPLAPEAALMQMGSVLPRIIIAMAQCPEDSVIYFSKFDIADGFWRVLNELGKEYNFFAFVMPTSQDEPIQIVVPSSIQMGWVDAPAYFSGASETARDVAAEYAEAPIGALPEHHLERKTELPVALAKEMSNPAPTKRNERKSARDELLYLLEVYIDDFIAAARAKSPEELQHISRAILHAIHDVFPEGTALSR